MGGVCIQKSWKTGCLNIFKQTNSQINTLKKGFSKIFLSSTNFNKQLFEQRIQHKKVSPYI